MKEMTCIICPRGCRLTVDDNMNVSGNFCPRGKAYAISELTNPVRTITSSVRVINREDLLCSVKTSGPVPKGKIFDVMEEINKLGVEAPTHIGDIVLCNILGLGVDVVITKCIK
ncbi:MAG: DUF1667 domain-containing protein [Bacilli bacterium]|nr:DUF1667 domain-containing protein [Bacilli bacterium]